MSALAEKSLRKLAVTHYFLGALMLVALLWMLVLFVLTLVFFAINFSTIDIHAIRITPPGVASLALGMSSIPLAPLVFIAGSFFKRAKHYNFLIFVSFAECLWFPFGTALGIITLAALKRQPVRALFKRHAPLS